jgi:hypothetical protein
MTPKEKAKLLYNRFLRYVPAEQEFEHEYAKQCALIAVDEILNNNNKIPGNVSGLHTIENTYYWQQVKQELEKI